jgi:hypothetical protein
VREARGKIVATKLFQKEGTSVIHQSFITVEITRRSRWLFAAGAVVLSLAMPGGVSAAVSDVGGKCTKVHKVSQLYLTI